jgi:hypothetical protein
VIYVTFPSSPVKIKKRHSYSTEYVQKVRIIGDCCSLLRVDYTYVLDVRFTVECVFDAILDTENDSENAFDSETHI